MPSQQPAAAQDSWRGAVVERFWRQTGDERHLIESVRVVLAIIAGFLILNTPVSVRNQLATGVIAFSVYAGALLWLAANTHYVPWPRAQHWLDACWFLLLVGLAGEAGIGYFLFLFFPVLFASWRRGVAESTAVAAFSSLAALVVFALHEHISWAMLLALPLSLLITGSLVAVLARAEGDTRQGYAFVASLVERIDPRRGFDVIMPILLENIAREFDATYALLLVRNIAGEERALCWDTAEGYYPLSAAAVSPLLECVMPLPGSQAYMYRKRPHRWSRELLRQTPVAGAAKEPGASERAAFERLAGLLDQSCLMVAPMLCRSVGRARLILSSPAGHLRGHELEVLVHVVEQLAPSIENALLLERLASEAVDSERAKIGRTLHDSAIQPYIGLKFAIEALVRQAGPDNPLSADLQRLQNMASEELAAMRDVVSGLRGAPGQGGALLANAVHSQAKRFGQLFGVEVDVDIDGKLPVSRRIAGELFHLVAEGLSNIRRHTTARHAWIKLLSQEGFLILSMRNECDGTKRPADFLPRSISERAETLGGAARVDHNRDGTTVTVTLPLE